VGISAFPPARAKAATTLLNLCVTLGGALTVSLLATLLEQRQYVHQALLAETQLLPAVGTQQGLHALERLATQLGGGLSIPVHAQILLSRLIDREASLLAFNDCFGVFVFIALCGGVLALFFRRAHQQR
jgi:hypothetical protein